jgi:adenylate cyclase, class 2
VFEVEVKARLGSLEEARAKAGALGGVQRGVEEQRDTYWAHPVRDFAATDEALRLRLVPGQAPELTYKGPKVDARSKAREERTLALAGADAGAQAEAILGRLGFRPVATVAKRRETWEVQGLEVALDEVEGLGAFLEVEAPPVPREQVPEARDRVLALLRALGGGESIRTSYLELLLAEQGKR